MTVHVGARQVPPRPKSSERQAALGALFALGMLCAINAINARVDSAGAASVTPTTTTEPRGSVRLDPEMMRFEGVMIGESGTQTMTVTATGGDVEMITAHANGPFEVLNNGCTTLNDEDPTCSMEIRFTPTEQGVVGGTLRVESSAGVELAALEGTGTLPSSTTVPPTTGTTPPPMSTTPPPTSTTPPPTSTRPEGPEECDARALRARITYAPRQQMHVDESESVEVKASTGDVNDTTTSRPAISTTVVPQALRCQVRARLVGNDFTINPEEWQAKSFLGTDEVVWLWLATPKVVGDDLILILEVQGLALDVATGKYRPAGDAFQTTAEIQVDSEPKGFLTRFNSAVSGVVTHPIFALFASTGALALAAGWMYGRVRSARARQSPSASPSERDGDDDS